MIQAVIGAAIGFALGHAATQGHSKASPISKDVSKEQWKVFCTRLAVYPKTDKHVSGRLGAFGISPRRLADLNIVTATQKTSSPNNKSAWVATWKKPFSEEAFRKNLPLQYAVFTRSMRRYLPTAYQHRNTLIDNTKATTSGLLGVLHVAGEAGLASWLSDPKVRAKFKHTTETFKRTNGVF